MNTEPLFESTIPSNSLKATAFWSAGRASRYLTSALLGLVLSGCANLSPPAADRAVSSIIPITAPLEGDVVGDLALLDDGTWSYVSDLPLPAKVGESLLLTDIESKERHVFGVATITPWGAVLGRLDRHPISPRFRGSFGPASAAICLGNASQRECVDNAPTGTWFSVFEARGDKLVFENGVPARIGRIRAGDASSDQWTKAPGEWIGVSDGVGPPAPSLRLGITKGCDSGQTDLFTVSATMPGIHPLDIENQAFEDLVDAYVSCSGHSPSRGVAIPSAVRPVLSANDVRLQTHPILVVGKDRIVGDLDDVGRFAAMIGVGDFEGAGLLLLKLAPKNPKIALQAAEILAATGRPEEALALAFQATKTAWNREGDFHWVFLRARVALILGDEASFVERWARLPDMAQRLENTGVYGWVVWHAFMAETKGFSGYDNYDKSLKGRELSKWRTLLRLTSALRAFDDADIKSFSASATEAKALSAALRGEGVAKPGDGPLDVYGRLWASGVRGDLTRVGGARFRPGYSHRPDDLGAVELLSLNKLEHRSATVEELDGLLACDAPQIPPTKGLGLDSVALWALSTGREAACKGPADLLETAARLPKERRPETQKFVAVLFEHMLGRQNDAETLLSASIWASSENLGEVCRRWNLAVGFSALIADRLEDAQKALVRSNACSSREYSLSEKNLAAGINWLRTGRVSGDFEAPVRDALADVTRQKTRKCPLLSTWDVRLEELAESAIRAHLVTMPAAVQEDFAVVTSLQHLANAQQSVDDFAAAIRAGETTKAAQTLQAMKSHFQSARHLPGLRFVELMDLVVFDGQLDDYSKSSVVKGKQKTVSSKLRGGKFGDTKGWNPTQLRVVEFLRSGDPVVIVSSASTEFPAELCAQPIPRSNDGPIDLDADF